MTLFDIYTGGKLIKKDIYVALSYLDKAILIAQKQNDEEMLSIACEKREVFFEKPDSLLKSPYLAPQLEEKYSGISKFLKTKVLPRKFFIWLEVSIRAGHEIEFSAIRKSLDDNYPYICENEIEHSFINNSNRPNPLENDIDGINTLIEQYYFSENCKHPYKYQYWIGRLERLAQEGNLEAQAIVIGNNYSYDLAVQEGRDSSDFSLYFSLKDNFKKKYETNLMELFSSGNGYAKLAIAKYMSHCIAIDRKKALQQAAGLGLTDAWYELGKLYSMEYLSKHKFLVEGYNGSKEYTLEMSCYENGLQCNNGKKVQLCRIKLKNNGEMQILKTTNIENDYTQKNLMNDLEYRVVAEIPKLLNSAFEALEKGAYAVAENHYNTILSKEPGNWEAIFFSTYLGYINITCDSSDLAISNMQSLLNFIPQSIHHEVSDFSLRTDYCNSIAKYAAKFCLQITELQFMKFDELVAYRYPQSHLNPVGFMNNYAHPRLEKLAYMLYSLGDNMEFLFSYGEAVEASKIAWKTGNTIMEMTKNHGGFSKKIEKKSIIKRYKNKYA